MESVFLAVLNMSLTAGWVILALFLLRLLLRRSPRWLLCLLWIPAAIRLVLPFSVESVLSLLPSGEPIPQEILVADVPQVHTGIEMLNSAVNPVIGQAFAPSTGDSATPMQTIAFVAAVVWTAGITILLTYAVAGYLRLSRRVRVSAPLEESGVTVDPRIRICDRIDSPSFWAFSVRASTCRRRWTPLRRTTSSLTKGRIFLAATTFGSRWAI